MVVTFCGHGDIWPDERMMQWLRETVETLILRGADLFYLGGYGRFDIAAASVVWELKVRYPDIESILVIPYLDRQTDLKHYDGVTYPPLEAVPKRYAILRRNRWMVDAADVVVAYVKYTWGGAAKTLEYAGRKGKEVINYADAESSGQKVFQSDND